MNDLKKHLKSLKKDRAKKKLPKITKNIDNLNLSNPEEFKRLEEHVKIKFPDLFVISLKIYIYLKIINILA